MTHSNELLRVEVNFKKILKLIGQYAGLKNVKKVLNYNFNEDSIKKSLYARRDKASTEAC